ncbi:MAG: OmpA family protein [Bacteroidales bacterium]|nr:OmpA family protein [Bacteroidales bacterium]
MKKLLLSAAALLLSLAAFAQKNEYLPKGEFTIDLFGGATTLANYKTIDGSNPYAGLPGVSSIGTNLLDPGRLGGGLGFSYIRHFNDYFGLVFGVNAALYRDYVQSDILYGGNMYELKVMNNNREVYAYDAEYFRINSFKEEAMLGAVQIPIMAQVKLPLADRVHLYLNVGPTIGFNVYSNFKQTAAASTAPNTSGRAVDAGMYGFTYGYSDGSAPTPWQFNQYIPQPNTTESVSDGGQIRDVVADNMRRPAQAGLYEQEQSGKLETSLINLQLSAEVGFRFALSRAFALYLGAYFDYGLINGLKKNNGILDNPAAREYYRNNRAPAENSGILGMVGAAGTIVPQELVNNAVTYSSLFNAQAAPEISVNPGYYDPTAAPNDVHIEASQNPYLKNGIHSAGIKLRMAFGKAAPKAPVAPQIVYVDRVVRDTVVQNNTVVVRDTVTNTVVEKVIEQVIVRDTVTIIKEVPVEIQQTMAELSNTMFDFDKSVIKEAAKEPLNKVVVWLLEHPKVKVEISGHTDNRGSAAYNQRLSEARAKAVYDYFVSQGVDKFRLAYAGYGMDKPIATNDTDEGRQQNRRVELNIVD